ncbi:MAG: Grx4 family monothiol glutaredoxin [Pseudomonadota bacterium]|jgi:monothiol glutaredoxin
MNTIAAAESVQQRIAGLIAAKPVVLFMKGTAVAPHCGFSAGVVQILAYLGVDYLDIDILQDESLRQGVKVYSDWPTFPQLYVQGQLIGGADIVKEMFQSGELKALLADYSRSGA